MQDESIKNEYHVITVEKTSARDGMSDDNWYRPAIQRGRQIIDCKKNGTLKAVTEHAESVAELINSRHLRGGRK